MSRPCPSCGRRVPSSVFVCRCGAEVPLGADDEADVEDAPRGPLSPVNLAIGALLLAGLAGAIYSAFRPSPEAAFEAPPPRTVADARAPAAPPPAPAPGTEMSAERRAWEAEAARAAEATPPTLPAPVTAAAEPAAMAPAALGALEDVVGRVMPAVVLVETSTARGSAFFVRPDTLITNVHVVKDERVVTLRRMDGRTESARVESKAPGFDIAILRVTAAAGQAVIPMGSARTLRPGQEVITIGSALGTLQNSVSRGIVSGVRQAGEATLVQTDAAANPGNSGGPLLDRSGVAIGITTMGYRDSQGLNFAVAIDHARDLLEGRVMSTSGPPLALNEVKPAGSARPSESERAQDEGQRAFHAAMARLAQLADALDRDWQTFRQSCYTAPLSGSYSHEWFAVLSPRAITASQLSVSCRNYLAAFQTDAAGVGAEIRSSLEAARRAGVLPGTVRDALRANRLEFEGWDR